MQRKLEKKRIKFAFFGMLKIMKTNRNAPRSSWKNRSTDCYYHMDGSYRSCLAFLANLISKANTRMQITMMKKIPSRMEKLRRGGFKSPRDEELSINIYEGTGEVGLKGNYSAALFLFFVFLFFSGNRLKHLEFSVLARAGTELKFLLT